MSLRMVTLCRCIERCTPRRVTTFTRRRLQRRRTPSKNSALRTRASLAQFPPADRSRRAPEATTPVFYRDSRHTFFIDPSVEETTFDKWEEWVVPVPIPGPEAMEASPELFRKTFLAFDTMAGRGHYSPETTIIPFPKTIGLQMRRRF